MSCKMCGKCCDPIIMNYSFEHIKDLAYSGNCDDALFILNDCIRISAAEAKILRPDLKSIEDPLRCNFFVCWYFNDDTRLCEHLNKPGICTRFPENRVDRVDIDRKCGYYKISLDNIKAITLL